MIKTILRYGLLLSGLLLTATIHADGDKPPYNYEATVQLVVINEQGAYIHQRPNYESNNGFMFTFGIVHKYVYAMNEPQAPVQHLLPVDYKLLLINHNDSQTLFLGDHWLGNGEFFTLLNTADYARLTSFIQQRIKVSKPTPHELINSITKNVHTLWREDPEYYRQKFYPSDTQPEWISKLQAIKARQPPIAPPINADIPAALPPRAPEQSQTPLPNDAPGNNPYAGDSQHSPKTTADKTVNVQMPAQESLLPPTPAADSTQMFSEPSAPKQPHTLWPYALIALLLLGAWALRQRLR